MGPSSVVLAEGCTRIWVRRPWQRPPARQKQSKGTETHAWHLGDSKVSPPGRKDQSRATELSCTAPASHCLGCAGRTVLGSDHAVQGDNGPWKGCSGTSKSWMPGHRYWDHRSWDHPGASRPRGCGMPCNQSGQRSPVCPRLEARGHQWGYPGWGRQNEQGGARDGAPLPALGDVASGRRLRFLSGARALTKPPTRRGSAPRRPRRPGPPPAAADKGGTALIYPPPSRDRRQGGGLRRCAEAPAGWQGETGHRLHPATKGRSGR